MSSASPYRRWFPVGFILLAALLQACAADRESCSFPSVSGSAINTCRAGLTCIPAMSPGIIVGTGLCVPICSAACPNPCAPGVFGGPAYCSDN